jgi:hypothetical protein
MAKTKRDESLPRVSDLKHFLNEEEFNKIPKDILSRKAKEGTRKHGLLEKYYDKETPNPLVNMFKDGMKQLFTQKELSQKPIIEKQLNGSRFTGCPDLILGNALVDYKFTVDLRASTALQIVLYAMLHYELTRKEISRLYAFHFPGDWGLFMYKVPDRTIPILVEFAEYIIGHHEAIKAGELERYKALSRWDMILQDYEAENNLFELVDTVLAPPTITTLEEAEVAAVVFAKIGGKIAALKRELKRYMEDTGETRLFGIDGSGVRLDNGSYKVYDKEKKAAAKRVYDEALKACLLRVEPTKKLVRVSPKKNEPKLIK